MLNEFKSHTLFIQFTLLTKRWICVFSLMWNTKSSTEIQKWKYGKVKKEFMVEGSRFWQSIEQKLKQSVTTQPTHSLKSDLESYYEDITSDGGKRIQWQSILHNKLTIESYNPVSQCTYMFYLFVCRITCIRYSVNALCKLGEGSLLCDFSWDFVLSPHLNRGSNDRGWCSLYGL